MHREHPRGPGEGIPGLGIHGDSGMGAALGYSRDKIPPLSPSQQDTAQGWHFCLVPALLQLQDSRGSPVPPRPVTPRGSPRSEIPSRAGR